MIREIMSVDNVEWDAAQPRFDEMLTSATGGTFLTTLPYVTDRLLYG